MQRETETVSTGEVRYVTMLFVALGTLEQWTVDGEGPFYGRVRFLLTLPNVLRHRAHRRARLSRRSDAELPIPPIMLREPIDQTPIERSEAP